MNAIAFGLRRKLTETTAKLAAVPDDKRQVVFWDSEVAGFGLRCLTGGAKTWIYVYRAGDGGRNAPSQTLKLGSWPTVSVENARRAARIQAGAVAHGRDPAAERREERRRERELVELGLIEIKQSGNQAVRVSILSTKEQEQE